jgi:predicted DNA-binding protein YlxM (UPF0122 family)
MEVKEILKHLKQNENLLHVIHYSCENLNDNNDNYSPRITSIAIIHISSYTTHSFSMHLIAEEMDIARENITDHYDEVEKQMLIKFYDFIKNHQNALWIHWNMSNINYGFEAIAHRYKVLTKEDAPTIDDTKKFNLSYMILSIYGKNCVDHPRMPNLMKLNGGMHRDVLLGEDEVQAFKNKEYIKLHNSTMAKAGWFENMYQKLQQRKIKTTRTNWLNKLSTFVEHPVVKLFGVVAVVYTLIDLTMKFAK